MTNDEALWNWSYYLTYWLDDPAPTPPTTCRSFEKNHVPDLGNVMDEEDDKGMPSIDWKLGELYESCMKELPEHHRRALKAYYVSFPYQSNYNIANHLRINVKKLENDLQEARARINKEVNRKISRDKAL
jgi:DNA-directed RNA polymerase specialized sigma24 family protein